MRTILPVAVSVILVSYARRPCPYLLCNNKIIIIIIIQSARMLAPSAFLLSAASTLPLQQSILPDSVHILGDQSTESAESSWTDLFNSPKPAAETHHIQKAWDGLVATNHQPAILSRARSTVDKARLLATASPHAGDWLHAPPITAVGLRLSDEAVRIAVAQRHTPHATRMCLWKGGRQTWAA